MFSSFWKGSNIIIWHKPWALAITTRVATSQQFFAFFAAARWNARDWRRKTKLRSKTPRKTRITGDISLLAGSTLAEEAGRARGGTPIHPPYWRKRESSRSEFPRKRKTTFLEHKGIVIVFLEETKLAEIGKHSLRSRKSERRKPKNTSKPRWLLMCKYWYYCISFRQLKKKNSALTQRSAIFMFLRL